MKILVTHVTSAEKDLKLIFLRTAYQPSEISFISFKIIKHYESLVHVFKNGETGGTWNMFKTKISLPGMEEWKLVDTAEKFCERNAACPMY